MSARLPLFRCVLVPVLWAIVTSAAAQTPLPPAAAESDLDGDGVISRAEAGPLLRARFGDFDRDGSGTLDAEEVIGYFRTLGAERAAQRNRIPPEPWPADRVAGVDEIDTALTTMVSELGLAGAAVIVGREGRVISSGHAGNLDTRTILPVASVSKWVSAIILMQAVERGEVQLDAPLSAYLPDLRPDWTGVTLRQAFSHTGGSPRGHVTRYHPEASPGEVAAALVSRPLVAEPGTAFAYGGESMQVGAWAIERASGRSWRELFRTGILTPLGLSGSSFGHPVWWDPEREIVTPNVAGGLRTSADDLFAILQAVAGQGEVRLLSEASLSTMESDLTSGLVQTFRPAAVDDGWSYGLGLWCEHTAAGGCGSVSSAGAYGTYPWVDRETGTYGVVVTLGNVMDVMPHARRMRAMAGSLGAVAP